MEQLNNKRIAKNAIMLTIRMMVVAIVGLYTSRIVLNALGIDDYGVYGLAGGMVGMVSFLNGAMGGATSRFITFELGTGNTVKLTKIFSTALIIHLIIAGIAVIIMEIVGIWMLNYKLQIPPDSLFAANIVFQLSVLSMIVGFTQVPYTASILAHERMSIYAYLEIFNVVLKLLIVYAIMLAPSNRLIFYAILMFIASLTTAMFYRWYCIRHFQEARFSIKLDKSIAKSMLLFSGYDLFGNMSVMVYLQGLPIILNLFYGVVANAASGIGTTITGAIKGFSWSVSSAFIPQVTKQYAAGKIEQMGIVMRRSIQFTALVFSAVGIVFFVETERILFLWLGQVPDYAVVFTKFILLVTLVDYLTMSNNRGIHATGNIKRISFISGSFYLIAPFVSYAFMKMGTPVYTPYLVNVIMLIVVTIIGGYILYNQIPEFDIKKYVLTILRTYITILLTVIFVSLITNEYIDNRYPVYETDFWQNVLVIVYTEIIGLSVLSALSLAIVFSKSDRTFIKHKLVGLFVNLKRH